MKLPGTTSHPLGWLGYRNKIGTSSGPVVKTHPSNAGGGGLIPSPGTKIPYALGCGQK